MNKKRLTIGLLSACLSSGIIINPISTSSIIQVLAADAPVQGNGFTVSGADFGGEVPTLQKALETDNAYITLLGSLSYTSGTGSIYVGNNVTLDLGGFILDLNSQRIVAGKSGATSGPNGSIKITGENGVLRSDQAPALGAQYYGSIDAENVTIETDFIQSGSAYPSLIQVSGTARASFDSVTIAPGNGIFGLAVGQNSEVTLTGENNFHTKNVACIASNGTSPGQEAASITIESGTYISDSAQALYLPSYDGITTITGGNFTGSTGIEVRGGSLTITPQKNVTIKGNGTSYSTTPNNSGGTVVGAGIALSEHSTGDDMHLTVNKGSGTLMIESSATDGKALGIYNIQPNSSTGQIEIISPVVSINYGDFISKSGNPLEVGDDITLSGFVNGGNYSYSLIPSDFLNPDLKAEIIAPSGNARYSYSDSVKDAFNSVKNNPDVFSYLINEILQAGQSSSYAGILRCTYDLNGGTGNYPDVPAYLGMPLQLPAGPVRSGYTFNGWNAYDGFLDNGNPSHLAAENLAAGSTYVFSGGATMFVAQWKLDNTSTPPSFGPSNPSNPSTPPSSDSGDNNGTNGSGPAFTEPGTVIKPNADGSSTTFTQDEDGTKTATTVNSSGNITDVQVTVPPTAITDGAVSVDLGKDSEGQTIKIPGNITEENKAPEVSVKLPQNAAGTTVEFELKENTGLPGTVAMIEDENGNWIPLVDSVAIGDSFFVKAGGGSSTILIKDNSKSFSDVAINAWYDDAVAFVSARDIMNGSAGSGSATFAPDETLTRAMLAQMIANMEGQTNTSKETNPWYLGAMNYVMSKGLMGVASPFNADDPITRQDLALVLWRNAGKPAASLNALDKYSDASQVADYAKEAVAWAVENGILGVNSPINPSSDATRAEIAKMVMQYTLNQFSK